MTVEESLDQLEFGIKRLKVQYDMFFTGALKRQPYELRRQIDQSIRSFSISPLKKYHHRFHLNTLVGRYNALCEFWNKQLRSFEEGGRSAAAASHHRARPAPQVAARIAARVADGDTDKDAGEKVLFSIQVTNPEAEPETMRALYDSYVAARRADSGRPSLKLESFVKQVARQASNLKNTSGCETLEFRILVKGDAVSLKARAGKQEP